MVEDELKTKKRKLNDSENVPVMDDDDADGPTFVSPLAQPLLEGKLLERAQKLLKKSVAYEKSVKSEGKPLKNQAQMKRGVAEVTKAIRKDQKGVVFLASDVYPIDIIAHLPVFCEDKGVLYCYLGTRRALGSACRTKRPASVVMVVQPLDDAPSFELYQKFFAALKEQHPYF